MSEAADTARAAEASRWFTIVTNASITVADVKRFRAWQADPDNAAAFEKVERMWGRAETLKDLPAIRNATADVLARFPPIPLEPTPFKLRPLIATIAVALGVATAGALYTLQPWQPTYATAVGAQRLETLADGSRVRLNTDSKIQVRMSGDARHIRLLKGEAFFEVAHDAARPFVVEADGARVRALGTKFDVRRDAGGVAVTLVQGRVEVRQRNAAQAIALAAGEGLTVSPKGISAPRRLDVADATDWTTGQLNFNGVPLSAVIAEMNRYTTRKIVLKAPDAVAAERVSGRFTAGDTDNFIAALHAVYGLRVTTKTPREIQLSPS